HARREDIPAVIGRVLKGGSLTCWACDKIKAGELPRGLAAVAVRDWCRSKSTRARATSMGGAFPSNRADSAQAMPRAGLLIFNHRLMQIARPVGSWNLQSVMVKGHAKYKSTFLRSCPNHILAKRRSLSIAITPMITK